MGKHRERCGSELGGVWRLRFGKRGKGGGGGRQGGAWRFQGGEGEE